ncbi:hypothetical protein [Noviherbaspirillum sp. ST9]|uniref:hypothetical protein n=1 Tax=Noviherbaspirillum sp. ST9 TaxID=3401606 RepID=UPI003B587300
MLRLLKTLLVVFLLHLLPAHAGLAVDGQDAHARVVDCVGVNDATADQAAADGVLAPEASAQDDLEPADPACHIAQFGKHRQPLLARRLQTGSGAPAFSSHIPRGPDRPDWIRAS